jgi:uncharacterized membrane-anchored protein YjiN (DUF445 family)
MLTPKTTEKERALRRMKVIATGAFLTMVVIYALTKPLGSTTILWVIRWDHVNAFAEAAMVGALADWFAVVALFRHPLGIPIWHTAIVPRKKAEIGRNLGNFVETRLLSVENLTREIGAFSVSAALRSWLVNDSGRAQAAAWLADGVGAVVASLDDDEIEHLLGDVVTSRLHEINASLVLAGGLDLLVSSGRHEEVVHEVLERLAEWVPSHRATIEQFIERSVENTLKWGSKLVPQRSIDRATDKTVSALIEVLSEAAGDPEHPFRMELNGSMAEWASRLRDDPKWIERVNEWKNDLIGSPGVRAGIGSVWTTTREWIASDLTRNDSRIRGYAARGVDAFRARLDADPELGAMLDERLRDAAVSLLSKNHSIVGELIQKVVDSWEGERLSREIELNLGRDLQYIRLNGTIIGGFVGLLIHVVSG